MNEITLADKLKATDKPTLSMNEFNLRATLFQQTTEEWIGGVRFAKLGFGQNAEYWAWRNYSCQTGQDAHWKKVGPAPKP